MVGVSAAGGAVVGYVSGAVGGVDADGSSVE